MHVFPLKFSNARSMVVLSVLAAFLGWFRTRNMCEEVRSIWMLIYVCM
jgi:hypothetical protein